ncbi:MAG: hypothetical protein WBD64_07925 [Candidatus Zixiibacteriota bacterium]
MKKGNVNLLVFAICVLVLSSAVAEARDLKLEISLSDTTYYVCQSIWLDAQLTNISADSVRVFGFEFPGGDLLNIVLTDESGDTLRPQFPYASVVGWQGVLLYPKETYYETFDLADIFTFHGPVPGNPAFQQPPSLAAGRYEVYAEYPAGESKLSTPKLTFEVAEPTGTEREAFGLYVEAYRSRKRNDDSLAVQQLNKLITNYPKSVCAERALWRLKSWQMLMERFPDSGFNLIGLRNMTGEMDNKKKQTFLQQIVKEHSGTRSAKFAEQLLREVKRKDE